MPFITAVSTTIGGGATAEFHAVRVLGPSYYPGLGEIYPPYANPCHISQTWSGYYAGSWTYRCFW